MQIASGWSKGLKLETATGLETRPTRERVRSAALNMLQPWISDAQVLDLFAGSGAVGLELVSRGAASGTFVERAPHALKALKLNLRNMEDRAAKQGWSSPPQLKLIEADVLSKLSGLGVEMYDLIWADPPYQDAGEFLAAAKRPIIGLLKAEGVFAFECGSADQRLVEAFSKESGLAQAKQRQYGVTLITIWQKR